MPEPQLICTVNAVIASPMPRRSAATRAGFISSAITLTQPRMTSSNASAGKRLAQQQRPPAGDREIDRRERARPPARAQERRAAAVDDVNRAGRYCAAVGRGIVCDSNSPIADSIGLDADRLPRARCVPLQSSRGPLGPGSRCARARASASACSGKVGTGFPNRTCAKSKNLERITISTQSGCALASEDPGPRGHATTREIDAPTVPNAPLPHPSPYVAPPSNPLPRGKSAHMHPRHPRHF